MVALGSDTAPIATGGYLKLPERNILVGIEQLQLEQVSSPEVLASEVFLLNFDFFELLMARIQENRRSIHDIEYLILTSTELEQV